MCGSCATDTAHDGAGIAAPADHPVPDSPAGDRSSRQVPGDWDDAEAAALAGASACEMAVQSQSEPSPEVLVFTLTTIRDEPGALVFTLVSAPPDGSKGPATIALRARVGRIRDPAREAALLDAVAERFAQLAGRDFAPRR